MDEEGKQITGYFIRMARDGRFGNYDIAVLTDKELVQFFATRADGAKWAIALAGWIRDNVEVEGGI